MEIQLLSHNLWKFLQQIEYQTVTKQIFSFVLLQDVLNLLLEYIELRGLRVVDFFRQLDKDNSKKITRAEFMNGVKKTGIPMTRRQLKKLVRILDTDNDGNIDYGEMVAIKKDDVFDFYHKKKTYKKDDPLLQSFKSTQQKKAWTFLCDSRIRKHTKNVF